jgi:hypothetical protein
LTEEVSAKKNGYSSENLKEKAVPMGRLFSLPDQKSL